MATGVLTETASRSVQSIGLHSRVAELLQHRLQALAARSAKNLLSASRSRTTEHPTGVSATQAQHGSAGKDSQSPAFAPRVPRDPTRGTAKTGRLPAPVRSRIAHSLDMMDRLSLAQVDRAFRDALLDEPTLWNRITLPLGGHFAYLEPWKRAERLLYRVRSARTPAPSIHINTSTLTDPSPSASAMWAMLDVFLHEASTLSLMMYPWPLFAPPSADWWRQEVLLWFLLCQEAPALERLKFTAPRMNIASISATCLPMEFLGANPGALRACSLHNLVLRDDFVYPAFKGLHEFHYCAPNNTREVKIASSSLQNILNGMPQLEFLGLASLGFCLDAEHPSARHDLLRQVVTDNIWDGVLELARFFEDVPTVEYNGNSHSAAQDIYDTWPTGDLDLAVLDAYVRARPYGQTFPTSQRLSFSIWHRIEWTPTGEQLFTLAVPVTQAHRIVSLNLLEDQWEAASNALPPLPRIKIVSIVLSTCYTRRHGNASAGCFSLPSNDVPQWQTQLESLAEVQIHSGLKTWLPSDQMPKCVMPPGIPPRSWGCSCSLGCTLSLLDLANFIHALPLGHGRRLQRLVLYRIDNIVDVEPGLALCELLKLVDEVEGVDDTLPEHLRSNTTYMPEALGETPLAQEMVELFEGTMIPSPSRPLRPIW